MYNKPSKNINNWGSGLIGSSLTKNCQELGLNYKSTYYSNKINPNQERFDLNDISNIDDLVKKDDIVVFCSALANPNYVFVNQKQAYEFNVVKTINFIKKIKDRVHRLIFLSSVEVLTDKKVIITRKIQDPLNFYGRTKHEVENFISE